MDRLPLIQADGKPIDLRASMAGGSTIGDKSHESPPAKTIPFAVVSCSGQDEDYPASELSKGVLGRGWQSSRFCCFPQELVLKLQQPSRITNMQLLCHEYKIPSKVEVFVSTMVSPYVHSEEAIEQMKRLGYLSLDPNDRSGHQARELKSIHVDSSAAAIRLVLHDCYSNKLNVHNQVALMTLIVTGDPIETQQILHLNQQDGVLHNISRIQVTSTKAVDARIQLPSLRAVDVNLAEFDTSTAARLHLLYQEKNMAVSNEDYDEAKRIKIMIERLKERVKKIKELERQKLAAVEVEDYDTAKLCKMEIERLQLSEEAKDENGKVDTSNALNRSEHGITGAISAETLQEQSTSEGKACASIYATSIKECGTQTVEDKNKMLEINKDLEDSGPRTSEAMSDSMDSIPAYSCFKIRPENISASLISPVCENEKQTKYVSASIPWWHGDVILNSSEISPPPTVGQQGSLVPAAMMTTFSPAPSSELPSHKVSSCSQVSFMDTGQLGSSAMHTTAPALPCCQVETPNMQHSVQPTGNITAVPAAPFHVNHELSANRTPSVPTFIQQKLPLSLTLQVHPTMEYNNGSSAISQLTTSCVHLGMASAVLPVLYFNKPQTMHSRVTGTHYVHQIEPQIVSPLSTTAGFPISSESSSTIPTFVPENTDQRENQDILELPREISYGHEPVTTQPSMDLVLSGCEGVVPQAPSSGEDIMIPEPLTDLVKLEAGPLLSVLDLYHVECLYSRQWQLREKTLQFLIDELAESNLIDEATGYFRMLNKALLRTLNDRVANVYNTSLQLLRLVVTTYSSVVSHRDLQVTSTGFISILLEKLGDSNARTKEASFEALMFLASRKELGISVVSGPLLKPPRNQGTWRPVLGRLHLLLHAIPLYGIQPPCRSGFPSDALMTFVSQAFNSPNGEVRNAAIKVTTEVYRVMGAPVEKYLKGIKPLIREVLTCNFRRLAHEVQQRDESHTEKKLPCKPLNADVPVRSDKRVLDIGLYPLVHGQPQELENGAGKSPELSVSSSKSSSPAQLGHELRVEKEPEPSTSHLVSLSQDPPDSCGVHKIRALKVHAHSVELAGEEEGGLQELDEMCSSRHSQYSDEEGSLDSLSHSSHDAEDMIMNKEDIADSCLFCGKQDPHFLEGDNLDLHFCQQCPMLASCTNCGQIVEISSLKDHYLLECTSGKRYVECQICYLAVPETRLTAHQKSKDCRKCKQHKLVRCPLCFHALEPGDKGWHEHILKQPGCLKNPRTLSHAS